MQGNRGVSIRTRIKRSPLLCVSFHCNEYRKYIRTRPMTLSLVNKNQISLYYEMSYSLFTEVTSTALLIRVFNRQTSCTLVKTFNSILIIFIHNNSVTFIIIMAHLH